MEKEKQFPTYQLTPETYLGFLRAKSYVQSIILKNKQITDYDYQTKLANDQVGLKGKWFVSDEYIQAKNTARLGSKFYQRIESI